MVHKGDSNVHVVFDGTKCGLNGVILAPTLGLPTVDSLLNMVEPGTWQGDIGGGGTIPTAWKCGKLRKGMNGLIYGNFGVYRGGVILMYLGGPCYTPHPLDKVYINLPIDESSFEWLADHKDAHRFMQARNEDHLMTTFHV